MTSSLKLEDLARQTCRPGPQSTPAANPISTQFNWSPAFFQRLSPTTCALGNGILSLRHVPQKLGLSLKVSVTHSSITPSEGHSLSDLSCCKIGQTYSRPYNSPRRSVTVANGSFANLRG